MALKHQDFEFIAGDTKLVVIVVADGNGVPIDLTQITAAEWSLSREPDGTKLLTKSLGSGVTVTNPGAGEVTVILAPADTAGREGVHAHALVITDAVAQVTHTTTGSAVALPSARAAA